MAEKKTIDDNLDDFFKEANPTADAVNALIKVEDRKKGKPSDVELKTDLDPDEIKVHTVLGVLSGILEANKETFNTECILPNVIEKKERKAISKYRKSRDEIVRVARQPDMNMMPEQENQSFVKRLFTSRKNRGIPPQ